MHVKKIATEVAFFKAGVIRVDKLPQAKARAKQTEPLPNEPLLKENQVHGSVSVKGEKAIKTHFSFIP